MSDEVNNEGGHELDGTGKGVPGITGASSFSVSGMYRSWFLDYASHPLKG